MTGLRDRVADLVDDALEAIVFAKPKADMRNRMPAFHAMWACDYHLIDELVDRLTDEETRFLVPPDSRELAETIWPVDVAMLAKKPDHWFALRFATATPAEVRGMVRTTPLKCATMSHARIQDGAWDAEMEILGLIGGRWCDIGHPIVHQRGGGQVRVRKDTSRERQRELELGAQLALSARLTARYSWHAAVGFNDGPRIVLPTGPRGCRALFKTRDVGEGRARRAALRHWVTNHFRERHTDNDVIDYVRDHLRGATQFRWNGLDCEILVSEYDLERNEFFKTQAAEWRAMRKHNRVRLRLKRAA